MLAPDILSIKVGINDVWHGLAGRREGVEIERFTRVYSDLLLQVRTFLPDCGLVLCEPSVIGPPQPVEGNEKLQPYIAAVRELAVAHARRMRRAAARGVCRCGSGAAGYRLGAGWRAPIFQRAHADRPDVAGGYRAGLRPPDSKTPRRTRCGSTPRRSPGCRSGLIP